MNPFSETYDPADAPGSVPVYIRNKAASSVRAGHPWLFEDSIAELPKGPGKPGDIAVLFDAKQNFLGAGLNDPESGIRVRILSNSKKLPRVGKELFALRMKEADQLRAGMIPPETDAWRLIHGESDGFSGVAADKYGHALCLKLYSNAWISHLKALTDAVFEAHPELDELVIRLSREIAAQHPWLDGKIFKHPDDPFDGLLEFRENGILFEADLVRGQKTGFFLDQRDNRAKVGDYCFGQDVLNVFSYSGGFSLYAARGGAKNVYSVDFDKHAIEACDRNFARNRGIPAIAACRHTGLCGDAFQLMKELHDQGKRFGVVIVDPPSFAKSAAETGRALHSYGRLAALAVRLLKKDGVLVAASCSSRVTREQFFDTVEQATRDAGHPVSVLAKTAHAVDHPAKFAESGYLKCLYGRVTV